MNTADIDITNMCSHLRHKLMYADDIYHPIWQTIQDNPKLTAVVRSRQPWIQADSLAHRNELNKQVGDMLDKVLPEEERELLRLYFGIDCRRHSMDELIALFDSERKVRALLQTAMERLRYSDEILAIYKYLHR